MIKTFELKVYQGSEVRDEPDFHTAGSGEAWLDYTRLKMPGFDGSISLNLEGFWSTAIENRHQQYEASVIGLETIFKLGKQVQLKERFYATVTLVYSDD